MLPVTAVYNILLYLVTVQSRGRGSRTMYEADGLDDRIGNVSTIPILGFLFGEGWGRRSRISTAQGMFPCLTEGSIGTDSIKGSPRPESYIMLQIKALAHKEINNGV